MEDTLRDKDVKSCGKVQKVLILVLMEDTLRGLKEYRGKRKQQ